MEIFIPFFILTAKFLLLISLVASAVYYCKWYACKDVPKSMAPIYESKYTGFLVCFVACLIILAVAGEL